MNHDATHCLDYRNDCPKECYRAQLTKELLTMRYDYPVSWAELKGSSECMRDKNK